jgi:DNA-binding MarR family transcriptional regulator
LIPYAYAYYLYARIIGILAELQEAGLITREPDPADRRARLLAITPAGRRVRSAAQADIQANENRVLGRLPAADRHAFLRAVEALSGLLDEVDPG